MLFQSAMSDFITLVINPAAGRGRVGTMVGQIGKLARQLANGRALEIRTTAAPGHASEIARQAPTRSRVVAVGGDGTVHETIQGLAGSEKALGVVPIGSGNDFARMVGLSGLGLEAALQLAFQGEAGTVDLGMVNGHPFGASLGLGFDAAVARKALTAPTFLRGMPRYLYSILAVLKELSLPTLTLESGGKVLYHGKALLGALMNSRTYGGGIPIAPSALHTDGMLSGIVAGEFSRLGVLGILPKLLQGKHVLDPRVQQFSGAQFTVRFDRPVAAHADGELLEPQSLYQVHLVKDGLRVVAPQGFHNKLPSPVLGEGKA
jgi:YegS/Rv2252/BmrU family lipid kinase